MKQLRVLVVGGDGRAHALAWRLAQSPSVERVFVAPGNPGCAQIATLLPCKETDFAPLVAHARREAIDLTVVSPETPLSLGIVDRFRSEGLRIFGPTRAAAQLESSKAFSKEVMTAAGVPTPRYRRCEGRAEAETYVDLCGAPLVLKADGLAAGKGVVVCTTVGEIQEGLRFLFEEIGATTLVIEEYIAGREASFFVATDGKRVVAFPTAHDYKRIRDGNRGPNTGGMGAISPTPYLTSEQEAFVLHRIIHPVLAEMERRGTPFSGFLYAGLMLPVGRDPVVIEFNCRFGDPECQPVMRRVTSDLAAVLHPLAEVGGDTPIPPLEVTPAVAACVVMAADGYPGAPRSGDTIAGIPDAEGCDDVVVFQAGTIAEGELLRTNGGRILAVTALGDDVTAAVAAAYEGVSRIQFDGAQFRRDIGGANG